MHTAQIFYSGLLVKFYPPSKFYNEIRIKYYLLGTEYHFYVMEIPFIQKVAFCCYHHLEALSEPGTGIYHLRFISLTSDSTVYLEINISIITSFNFLFQKPKNLFSPPCVHLKYSFLIKYMRTSNCIFLVKYMLYRYLIKTLLKAKL